MARLKPLDRRERKRPNRIWGCISLGYYILFSQLGSHLLGLSTGSMYNMCLFVLSVYFLKVSLRRRFSKSFLGEEGKAEAIISGSLCANCINLFWPSFLSFHFPTIIIIKASRQQIFSPPFSTSFSRNSDTCLTALHFFHADPLPKWVDFYKPFSMTDWANLGQAEPIFLV